MVSLNTEAKNYVIGRGSMFFAELKADGTLGGERPIGNTTDFAISVTSETLKHYDSSHGMRTQDREVPVQIDYAANYTTDDVNTKNLAALLLGDAEIATVSAVTGATETLTDIEQALVYQLGMSATNPAGVQQVSNVVVKSADDVTTYVLTTDYTVDAALGRITIVDGGGIADGADLHITYDIAATSQKRVSSSGTTVEGALRFLADNPEGDDVDYYLPSVKLSPNGDFQIKSENDWTKMPMKVSVSADLAGVAVYANGRAWTGA
jgi:hypothetical protein